jgi:hypothetical protein
VALLKNVGFNEFFFLTSLVAQVLAALGGLGSMAWFSLFLSCCENRVGRRVYRREIQYQKSGYHLLSILSELHLEVYAY